MSFVNDADDGRTLVQSELVDLGLDPVAASDLRLYEQSRIFLAANQRQLQQAKAGLEEAKCLGIDTSDWEYIVASCESAVAREQLQLDLLRSSIATHAGLDYVPKAFS